MCKKISSAISGIKLARSLSVDILKKLCNSLVGSQLRYRCTVWGNCGNCKLGFAPTYIADMFVPVRLQNKCF